MQGERDFSIRFDRVHGDNSDCALNEVRCEGVETIGVWLRGFSLCWEWTKIVHCTLQRAYKFLR